ncbi:hypothetical protein ACHAXT_011778 [Thalassiosira profunda]
MDRHLDEFCALLARAAGLLHRVEGVDWKGHVCGGPAASGSAATPHDEGAAAAKAADDEDDDSSSDDDMMLMMGGYSDSEDEALPGMGAFDSEDEGEDGEDAVLEDDDDDNEEEEEALLKRASSVHAALLLSLDTPETSGRELVEQVVAAILSRTSEGGLASALSFAISSGSIDQRPKRVGPERWRRVCLTNSLLAVQFLLHLLRPGEKTALDEWNVVILPLLFGGKIDRTGRMTTVDAPSLFLLNDALRDALLGLTSFPSTADDDIEEAQMVTDNLCHSALARCTSYKEVSLRQQHLAVACQVRVRLYDNVSKMKDAGGMLEAAKRAMHRAVMAILTGICYESEDGDGGVLSLESLRPMTGMLLPKLYPQAKKDGKSGAGSGVGCPDEERAAELWDELLLLFVPCSGTIVDAEGGKRRCCKNWDYVAPMTATAVLCIILPTVRELELPVDVDDDTESRPIHQPALWKLIRDCLGRCGDTDAVGSGGGRGASLLSSRGVKASDGEDTSNNLGEYNSASMDQLLRRRSAHALRLMVECERERLLREGSRSSGKKKKEKASSPVANNEPRRRVDLWMKYVLCFEMLEMEMELHLVEQVWETVREMTSEVANEEEASEDTANLLPRLTWNDIGSLLSRVLLSDAPTLRKLGLYRFLSGHTGINVSALDANVAESASDGNKPSVTTSTQQALLSVVSVGFVVDVVMRSYDAIVATKVGNNISIDDDGQQKSISIADLLSKFLSAYTITLATADGEGGSEKLSKLVSRVFGSELLETYKTRSVLLFYQSLATALDQAVAAENNPRPEIEPATIQAAIRSMRAIFSSGGAPKSMQQGLKLAVALALKNAQPWEKVDASVVLQILALYPPLDEMADEAEETAHSKARDAIGSWLLGLGSGAWAKNAASACASAYVLGQLLPYGEMDVMTGVNAAEREAGMAISILCSLSGDGSELLWPAVFKGLQQSVSATASGTPGFCKATRSMILLEFGCKEGVLSGMGNGDLVMDSKQHMMPPPPHIESLLGNAVQFVLSQSMALSTTLFETSDEGGSSSGSTRSSTSGSASQYVAILIGQLRTLHLAYPSSGSLSQAVDSMLDECVTSLAKSEESQAGNVVKSLTLTYAALSCGASFTGGETIDRLVSTCRTILGLELVIPPTVKKEAKQACRSIFQYAKWGSLSLLVPKIREAAEGHSAEIESVYQAILDAARDSVDATPVIALPPLFECALGAGQHIVTFDGERQTPLLSSLQTIIETLFAVLEEETSSSNWTYMLNEMCKLIFRGKLLVEEYASYSNGGEMPTKQAFKKLLRMAGTQKPYIAKTAVSRISAAWLSPEEPGSDMGLCAIPYREEIAQLLIFKECRIDESATHQSSDKWDALPRSTHVSSITRAFVLSFLSKLPAPGDISDVVLKELVQFIIMKLLGICCAKPTVGKAFISGSEEYARFTRALQALCLLSRYVTVDIAQEIAAKVFPTMAYNLHGQLRYFIEIFVIQCTRLHPEVFGRMLISEIRRSDLTLAQVASLMIIGGNLTVGRYSNDFFCSSADPKLKAILCGVLPWLSSTQGFSRAIAQLLCHKLIPLVVDVNAKIASTDIEKDDAVLKSVYSFLEDNADMSRLRVRQQQFFDEYDVDSSCTFEGLLAIPVDEGEEANPTHMVDAIKDCLAEVYKEAHGEDAPLWKQVEQMLIDADLSKQEGDASGDSDEAEDEAELVNFQRKILPIDALDLGIHNMQQQKLSNAAGKKKQHLVVCASLIDKVPNLAGLARTCEIFSAQTLVIPNLLVRKQDDFKSISASANDWIDMEECKEEDLLSWLYKKKAEGYAIVGVEQTASSKCLTKFKFPAKTVLLLGKEKEGLPIEFLSAVDQCIEIPQLGITRSLNVHVSGAIMVWEYTKQMMRKKRARK